MTSIPDVPKRPQTARQGGGLDPAVVFLGCALLWGFAAVVFFLLPVSVMGSDGCYSDNATQPICSLGVQQFVVFGPMITAPIAAIFGTWGLCSRRELAPIAWVVAMLILGGVWVTVRKVLM
ncbi:hypothetical protein CTZ27_09725 [Streptomyces griseocarneus]|nr:hypothetical protein CTZ27_09725 [Streptomyces griseocarneus]